MLPVARYLSHFCFLLPPLVIYTLALALFTLSVDPQLKLLTTIQELCRIDANPDAVTQFNELKARYTWFAAALLSIVVSLAAGIAGLALLRRLSSGNYARLTFAVGTVLFGVSVGQMLHGANQHDALYQMVFAFTYRSLSQSAYYSEGFTSAVRTIVSVINLIAVFTPTVILLAVCVLVKKPTGEQLDNPDQLAEHVHHLKELVNAGSAFLVFGVLHMVIWLKWPAVLVADPAARSALLELAQSIALYWGASYTLILISVYVCPMVYLRHRAKMLLQKEQRDYSAIREWLMQNGLSFDLTRQLPQYVIMLAPFIAGPMESFLSGVSMT